MSWPPICVQSNVEKAKKKKVNVHYRKVIDLLINCIELFTCGTLCMCDTIFPFQFSFFLFIYYKKKKKTHKNKCCIK